VKFDQLLVTARQIGAARIATGHYARIRFNPETHRYELWRAADLTKDQSYFLFGLKQEQMARTDFPLGELNKQAVREIAREARLPVAEKPESQEICFVPSGSYAEFIAAYRHEREAAPADSPLPLPQISPMETCDKPQEASNQSSVEAGELVTTSGEVLGRHDGIHHFTIGQRKGLGVSAGRPLYVVQIDSMAQRVVVGNEHELRRDVCDVRDVNWIAWESLREPVEAKVKIRYRHEPAGALIEPVGPNSARVLFHEPQRAITPGQAAVFYLEDQVLGGGWIV
jgi:tRNA-specific 2-thiouridylase